MLGDSPLYPRDLYRPPPSLVPTVPTSRHKALLRRMPCLEAPDARLQSPQTPFYSAFRRMAYLCKWVGCFPVVLPPCSSQLSFSWWSFSTIITLAFPIVNFIISTWGHHYDPIFTCIVLSYVSVDILIKLAFFCKIPILIQLVQMLDDLWDADVFRHVDARVTRKVNILIVSIVVAFVTITMYGGEQERVSFFVFNLTPTVICALLYAVCYQVAGLWDRLELAIADRKNRRCSVSLVERHRLVSCVPLTDSESSKLLLERHRVAYTRLVSCVRLVDCAFGNLLAIIYIFFSANIVWQLTVALSIGLVDVYMLMSLTILLFVYYPAVIIHRFQEKNKMILGHVFKMRLNASSDSELYQIMYFERQVEISQVAVSAAGIATINKEIIPKALSLFVSLFIALIQITPQIRDIIISLRKQSSG